MTVAEREALIEVLHMLVRHAFDHSGDKVRPEILAVWRESYDVLCAERCSADPPT